MSQPKPLDRRRLLQLGLYGLVGTTAMEQLAGLPLLGSYLDSRWRALGGVANRYDAYAMMGDALRGGPAMLGVHRAMAQDSGSDWTLVQIKVLNHLHTPLVFKLGLLGTDNNVTTAAGVPLCSARTSGANAYLVAKGVDKISDKPRYRALRFNKWFADILHNGTADGAAAGTTNILGLAAGDVAPLDPDKVAVQAALGMAQIDTNNHALKGCKLRASQPDITLFAADGGLITSPLGITCFMMGVNYDKAEGSLGVNAVLGKDVESAVVTSRTVTDYAAQIGQFVGKSYADRAPIEQNVIYKLDQLVQKDPALRRDLIASISQFQSGLSTLSAAAALETTRQTLDGTVSNSQNLNKAPVGALQEFLGQCKYVCASLDLPGTPVRNFSLFLNATDLDGGDLDKPTDGGGGNPAVQALSYIEAMRQLAIGLNMLGKAIAAGKKMMVIVHSEGGRDAQLTDGKTGFGLVMGPKGAGMLDDMLYANVASINQATSPAILDPGAGGSALAWDTDGLKEASGTAAASTVVPTTGDLGMGVIEFLEQQTGQKARTALTGADGRFVKLKRA